MRRKLLARRVNVSPLATVLESTPTVTTVLETTPTVTVKTVLAMMPKPSVKTEEQSEAEFVAQLMTSWNEKEPISNGVCKQLQLNQAITKGGFITILRRAKLDLPSKMASPDVELDDKVNIEKNEEFVTRAEAALFVFSVIKMQEGAANGYTDHSEIPEEMCGAVGGLSQMGYFSSTPEGRFCPNQKMTRGEVISLINHVVYNVEPSDWMIHVTPTVEMYFEAVETEAVETEVVEAEVVEAEAVETEAEEVEAHAVETEEAEEVEAYAVE
ncbi:MAG: S-layer homology domain-containing protein, partial [Bacillota bacterium]